MLGSCKKKGCTDSIASNYSEEATKDDGSCLYTPQLDIPTTYDFKDANGNSTVSYSGQTDRLNQLSELAAYAKSGIGMVLSEEVMHDMYVNTGDNGGGNFTFSSTKQLKNKCIASDAELFETYIENQATASQDYMEVASNGQAGTLSSGDSQYLFAANGIEYAQLIEKGLMGAVFMYQATQVYFGDDKMNADNGTAVDADAGKYYTQLEHHWDEAFGYFGAPIDFLTNTEDLVFWAKYCNSRNADLGSNKEMMDAFLTGRALISADKSDDQINTQINKIRSTWEKISAAQAINYFEGAKSNFGSDNAKYLHQLSEAYAFVAALKYVSLDTRVITYSQIESILNETIGENFWEVTTTDLTNAINELNTIYNF